MGPPIARPRPPTSGRPNSRRARRQPPEVTNNGLAQPCHGQLHFQGTGAAACNNITDKTDTVKTRNEIHRGESERTFSHISNMRNRTLFEIRREGRFYPASALRRAGMESPPSLSPPLTALTRSSECLAPRRSREHFILEVPKGFTPSAGAHLAR